MPGGSRPSNPTQILLITTNGKLSVKCLMGDGANQITDGVGGWQVTTRPRRVGFTQYMGRNPFTMTVNLLFDGFDRQQSQERQLKILTWMALPPWDSNEPPGILMYGALPYPSSGEWVINQMQFGNMTIWNKAGTDRVRQDVQLTMIRKVEADAVQTLTNAVQTAPPARTIHIVATGETLRALATQYYGDQNQWHTIANANGLTDPLTILSGMKLIIPALTPAPSSSSTASAPITPSLNLPTTVTGSIG
jgi:LysM repeat protein